MDLHLSSVGAAFAFALRPFRAPLPLHAADGVPVAVSVRPTPAGVLWERRIGHQVVRSVKSPGPSGTVEERTEGGFGMVLRVSAEDGALVFTSERFFLSLGRWRIPVPALLTPGRCRVEHRALGPDRFRFTLTMTHPLWGVTVRQDGTFSDMPEGYQP